MADNNIVKLEKEFTEKAEAFKNNQQNLVQERFANMIKSIDKFNPDSEEFSPLGALLTMNDDDFPMFSEIFLQEYEKALQSSNDGFTMAQALNSQGIKVEDLASGFQEIITELVNNPIPGISPQKVEFLKRVFMLMINAISETEGVGKKVIQIPIELCHPDAKIPAYAKVGDAGLDVFAVEDIEIRPGETALIPTGIKVAIPYGYELQVRPKSGRALKTKLRVANAPGTIDSGYRDEVKVIIENMEAPIQDITYKFDDNGRPIITSILHGKTEYIHKGEKFAQLVLNEIPIANFIETTNIGEIEGNRGGGFGSTGLK